MLSGLPDTAFCGSFGKHRESTVAAQSMQSTQSTQSTTAQSKTAAEETLWVRKVL